MLADALIVSRHVCILGYTHGVRRVPEVCTCWQTHACWEFYMGSDPRACLQTHAHCQENIVVLLGHHSFGDYEDQVFPGISWWICVFVLRLDYGGLGSI